MTQHQNAALIIVDMQNGMTSLRLGPRNNPQAEDNIAQLLTTWRNADRPVVHVRHMSRSADSVFWPGQPGAEFQSRFAPTATEHVVEKNVTDAFTHTGLERWLHTRGIKSLVIVGVSTNYSVEATARSAGCLGFSTCVASDACFTFDKIDITGKLRQAEDLHIVSLTNLAGEYASLVSTKQLLNP